jgi:hypothetical protein
VYFFHQFHFVRLEQAKLRSLRSLRDAELTALASFLCGTGYVDGIDVRRETSMCWISSRWSQQWKQYYTTVQLASSVKKNVSKKMVGNCYCNGEVVGDKRPHIFFYGGGGDDDDNDDGDDDDNDDGGSDDGGGGGGGAAAAAATGGGGCDY